MSAWLDEFYEGDIFKAVETVNENASHEVYWSNLADCFLPVPTPKPCPCVNGGPCRFYAEHPELHPITDEDIPF